MIENKKRLALLLALICLLIFITSALASGLDVGHECSGEDCLICIAISMRENLLHSLLLLATTAFVFSLALSYKSIEHATQAESMIATTPVCLKVKLSN